MAVSTVEEFLAILAKSRLLKPEQLAQLERGHAQLDRPVQPQEVAKGLVKRGLLTRWQAEKLLGGQTAFLVGNYKLLDRIGRGGMGSVFLAQHAVMGRLVALKIMSRELLRNPDAVARFKREVQSAAALDHPNIITAHDAEIAGDTHFLVMEYVAGHDLNYWIKYGSPLPVAWCCECIRQVALGLQHAHERGLVHRDIKPSNLLVHQPDDDSPPLIKILDMGLARLGRDLPEDGGITRSGQIMGTPDYIAPEQAADVRGADIRADIFSLGCTLFQCLTGELPFQGTTIMAKLLARANSDAPLVRAFRADVPRRLEVILAKMLARRPKDRYQTPIEVAQALAPLTMPENVEQAESSVLTSPSLHAMVAQADEEQDEKGLNEFLRQLQSAAANDTPGVGSNAARGTASTPSTPTNLEAVESGTWIRRRKRLLAGLLLLATVASWAAWWGWQGRQGGGLANRAKSTSGTRADKSGSAVHQGGEPKNPGMDENSGDTNAARRDTDAGEATDQGSSTTTGDNVPGGAVTPDGDSKVRDSDAEKTPQDAPATPPNDGPPPTAVRTWVVGEQKEELTFEAAIESARPGDTILVRHRGPLDFDPVDLTGKTPLTIAGDKTPGEGGDDFWPILRQAAHADDEAIRADGWWHAEQMDLTFRGVHLVVGGEDRPPVRSVFSLSSGAIRLEQCTLTVGVRHRAAIQTEPGLPLVLARAPGARPIQLTLDQSFLRGATLAGCVRARNSGAVEVSFTRSIWAGGAVPWIEADAMSGTLRVRLNQSTLYNLASLLRYVPRENLPAEASAEAGPLVSIESSRSLFVGAHACQQPLIAWQPENQQADLAALTEAGQFAWSGESNDFHRIAGYYREPGSGRLAELPKWHKLDHAKQGRNDRELDPLLRVHPSGWELQECEPRDFEPRWYRARKSPRASGNPPRGARPSDLPPALAGLTRRLPAPHDLASVPRGSPRVLVVHSTQGPYKTLEAAIDEVRDDEIIEIADPGPFIPRRNFTASPGNAVLVSPAEHVTIRAAEKISPLIILRDDVQVAPWRADDENPRLVLLSADRAGALCLDGLHLLAETSVAKMRVLTGFHDLSYMRCTNCTFRLPVPGNKLTGSLAHRFEDGNSVAWLENNFYFNGPRPALPLIEIRSPASHSISVTLTNCLCIAEPILALEGAANAADPVSPLRLQGNTLLGQVLESNNAVRTAWDITDNLVLSSGAVVVFHPAEKVRDIVHAGSRNALWVGAQPLNESDRLAGVNGLFPGPALETAPQLFGGESLSKDPWRPYRLKKGSTLSTLASDGGPVGVRIEYLPDLPPVGKR